MAIIGTVKKQPAEVIPFSISYEDVIGGDTATGVSHTLSIAPTGISLSSPSFAEQKMTVLVSGGTTATDYVVTVRTTMTLSVGQITVEDEVRVRVRET